MPRGECSALPRTVDTGVAHYEAFASHNSWRAVGLSVKEQCSKVPRSELCVKWIPLSASHRTIDNSALQTTKYLHNETAIMDNHDVIRELVKCYESKRVLWDSKHPEYYNKNKREDLWREISVSMNISVKELKKKMTSLLGSYRREKSREKKSQVTGSGQGDVYQSKWFTYTWFGFLCDKDMPNDQLDTMDNANTQRDPEETREESNNDESIVDEPTTVEDEPPESTNTTMASTTATAVSTSTATVPTSNM
ncbi:uncharacterized protein LOC116167519 [Photinus pyralis]|uniref:uncharacterized protein LOC116167519 n=1 Tax=Photinus pyralis TaxID=7054 RepID=UPI001267595B|nr:uncharacterized protein LOC116167519 [Photinus pyralis]